MLFPLQDCIRVRSIPEGVLMPANTSKKARFEELTREVKSCEKCGLCSGAKNKVMGEGDLDSRVVFVGEAPGRKEDETGRPFVGPAGKLLDRLLAGANLSRDKIFITNVVRCRPPGNRRPMTDEVEICSGHLERLLEIIEPNIIAPMGNSAIGYVFERFGVEKSVIGGVHGNAVRVKAIWGDAAVFPLYHPAAAIYNRRLLTELEKDMVELSRLLT
jgi:DNA polymerase